MKGKNGMLFLGDDDLIKEKNSLLVHFSAERKRKPKKQNSARRNRHLSLRTTDFAHSIVAFDFPTLFSSMQLVANFATCMCV